MKKILALMLTILLLTIAFISCNLDGTTGIFRDVAQSKAPLSIQYKQLLGINVTDLYFRTAEGVQRVTTAKVSTSVASSSYENIIQAAALYGDKVLYITNNAVERAGNIVNVVDTTNLSIPIDTIAITSIPATAISNELAIKDLYANSMILVTGKNVSGNKVFQLLKYDGPNFSTSVTTFTMPSNEYDLYAVIQQTAHEQKPLVADSAMLVSFVKPTGTNTGNYEHYLVTSNGTKKIISNTLKVANFLYDSSISDNMYVLSTDGILYYAGTYAVPLTSWVELNASGKVFGTNAFALAIDDGTDYHLITKPSTKTASLHVFTFPKTFSNTSVATGVDVNSGYAEELALATIVSSQVKTSVLNVSTDLLVATDEDGMYDISISNASANVDDSTNGISSGAEGYTFP